MTDYLSLRKREDTSDCCEVVASSFCDFNCDVRED